MRFVHIVVVLSALSAAYGEQCKLPLPRFRFFAPLIFDPRGNLLTTDSKNEHSHYIEVTSNDHLILSCAPNYFKGEMNHTKSTRATCKGGEIFTVNGVEKRWLNELSCEMRPVEEIIVPISGCSAQSVEFGYENPVKEQSNVLGEACYSEKEGRTIFIRSRIGNGYFDDSFAMKTEKLNYLAKRHPDSTYKIDYLVAARLDELNKRLESILPAKKIPFLELRHFADLPTLPNGQLYSQLKLGWNFFVSNGFDHLPNFDLLHSDLTQLKDSDLYMGTHGILSLKNAENRPVDVYLLPEEKKYPVPKYVWLVVKTSAESAAAFVIFNDITASQDDVASAELCESKCDRMPWLKSLLDGNAYSNIKNGYVWCCDLDSFARKVPEMPTLSGQYSLLA